ncbi:MAG: uroporphyrinogen-III synthase, partial [Sphingomicrobium sp.]
MTRLLVLRPEPGASATVKRARERGLDVIAIPLFEIEPVVWEAPQATDYDGLLLTSANAVRCGGGGLGRLRPLKVYAVGQ